MARCDATPAVGSAVRTRLASDVQPVRLSGGVNKAAARGRERLDQAVWRRACTRSKAVTRSPDQGHPAARRRRTRRAVRTIKKAHPALLVSDLPILIAALSAAGVEVVDDEPLEGYQRVYTGDSFGNRLELMEPDDR